jgi:hypothetical protein
MMGAIPYRVSNRGDETIMTHSCDLIVHPDYRRRSVAQRIIAQYTTDNPLGFAWVNKISQQIAGTMTPSYPVRPRRLVRPLAMDQIMATAKEAGRWSWLAVPARVAQAGLDRLPWGGKTNVTAVDRFEPAMDQLWARAKRQYPVSIIRDQRYLNWRYVARPTVAYTRLVARRGDDVLGYVVARASTRDGARWGHVVDYLVDGSPWRVLPPLIQAAVKRLRDAGAIGVTCLAPNAAYRHALYRAGFVPWGQGGVFYPSVRRPDAHLQILGDARQWFFTLGDGDVEMSF